jgi:hypothetical protein
MTDDQLIKVIQKAVKDEVRPLKDQVEIVKSKVNSRDFFQTVASENTRTIKEQQSIMNEKLDTLQDDLKEVKELQANRIYPSVVHTEQTIEAFGDAYKINDDNARKLEKRVVTLENKAYIQPPTELLLADVSSIQPTIL